MIKMIIWIVEGTIIRESGGENEKEMARMMIIRIVEGPIIYENEKEMAWMMMIRRW